MITNPVGFVLENVHLFDVPGRSPSPSERLVRMCPCCIEPLDIQMTECGECGRDVCQSCVMTCNAGSFDVCRTCAPKVAQEYLDDAARCLAEAQRLRGWK